MEEINRLFDGNTVEEIVENLKKEGSEWAEKQLNTLNKMVCTYTIKFIYVKKIIKSILRCTFVSLKYNYKACKRLEF